MVNIGQLLKKIRISRNFTQCQLCSGISSQAALSRMERSGNIPTKILIAFLERLNIELVDFLALAQAEQDENFQFFFDNLVEAMNNRQKANQLISKEMQLYRNTGILRHKINALCVRLNYCKYNRKVIEDYELIITEIKKYLLSLEYWFINDILLYINIFFIFDNSFIKNNHQFVLKSLEKSHLDSSQKHFYLISYSNSVIFFMLEQKQIFDLDFYLNCYQELLNQNFNSIDEFIWYSIFKKLHNLIQNYNESDYQNFLLEIKNISAFGLESARIRIISLINRYFNKD